MNYISYDALADFVYRLRHDDQAAFKRLFDASFGHLHRKAMYYLQDEDAAKDVVQEIFLNVWKNRDRLDGRITSRHYLERACINRALNYLRDRARFMAMVDGTDSLFKSEWSFDNPYTHLVYSELHERLFILIHSLPDNIKMPFILSRFEEMTYREIAETMEISEAMVERSIMKVLSKVRRFLRDYEAGNV